MPEACPMLNRARLFASFFALATVACAAVSGCAADTAGDGSDEAPDGETSSTDDEIVSERQLMGSELPAKTLALTYDDGPGPRTAELADYLADKGVPGTFFINGMKVPGRQAMVDKVIGRGHLLANHTQHHLQLTKLSSATVIKEVGDTDAIVRAEQPGGPFLIRAPFGAWNGAIARNINSTSMKKYVGSVFWDIGGELTATSAADWDCWGKGYSVTHCGDLYMSEIHKRTRGIVLMHDIHGKSVDMTKYILPKLIAEGYTFVKLQDVPSIKRALASAGEPDDGCQSATLGRSVAENACVQARRDSKWYRCVDGEWISSAGAADAKCTQRVPL
jgi:peptidoglycan-N-acetylglucosamine deacetylase